VKESGTTFYVHLLGDFDLASVFQLEQALDRLRQNPVPRRVVIDLGRLTFLDSAGLRTILKANERGRAEGFEVEVVRPRGPANRVFILTRAGHELNMIDPPELS